MIKKRAVYLLSVGLYSSLRTGASTYGMGRVGRNKTLRYCLESRPAKTIRPLGELAVTSMEMACSRRLSESIAKFESSRISIILTTSQQTLNGVFQHLNRIRIGVRRAINWENDNFCL